MVLNFGGGGLFNTSYEERWKGVNENRITNFNTAASNSIFNEGFGTTEEALTSITISVKPDEVVFVSAAFTVDMSTFSNDDKEVTIHVERTPGDVNIGSRKNLGIEKDGTGPVISSKAGSAITAIDNPGTEGNITYTLYGQTVEGTATLLEADLVAFVIAVK